MPTSPGWRTSRMALTAWLADEAILNTGPGFAHLNSNCRSSVSVRVLIEPPGAGNRIGPSAAGLRGCGSVSCGKANMTAKTTNGFLNRLQLSCIARASL